MIPNFIEISQTVFEISLFFILKMVAVCHLRFLKYLKYIYRKFKRVNDDFHFQNDGLWPSWILNFDRAVSLVCVCVSVFSNGNSLIK